MNTTAGDNLSFHEIKSHGVDPKTFIILSLLMVGVLGNFSALIILVRKRYSNSKYTLMLRFLLTNNLAGLLGLLTQHLLKVLITGSTWESFATYNCAGYVVCRFFGLSSGCIAGVMAIERWMALARPFTYHKNITHNIIKNTLKIFILLACLLTILPFFGFGLYDYNKTTKKCQRYRDATELVDIVYAYIFMIFGIALCVVIVIFNCFVARVLYIIGQSKTTPNYNYNVVACSAQENGSLSKADNTKTPPLFHSNSINSQRSGGVRQSDEIKFAKLMALLSCSFVICWMPQMISTLIALLTKTEKTIWFFKIAEILLLIHFVLDPFIYVLSRRKCFLFKKLKLFWKSGLKRSSSDQSRRRTEQTFDLP